MQLENAIEVMTQKISDSKSVLSQTDYKEWLRVYITRRYEKLIDSFGDNGEIDAIVQMYIDDEISFFSGLSDEEIRIVLVPDEALESLVETSSKAFELAKECKKNGAIEDDNYEHWLEKLSEPLDNIKTHNIPYAQEVLSEGILDIEFAYGKTKNISLRLGRCGF